MSKICATGARIAACTLLLVASSSIVNGQNRSRGRHQAGASSGPTPPPPGPAPNVVIDRELMITDLAVVEDPVFSNPDMGRMGVWSFKYLIEQMAGDSDPEAFALSLFSHGDDQQVNGYDVPARPRVDELILDPWRDRSGGGLDLAKAPVKLLAIVNRMDLREIVNGEVLSAGEGRFVFGVLDEEGRPLAPAGGPAVGGMTIILEYDLPAQSTRDLARWVNDWHQLGRLQPGSADYNMALARLTQRFTNRGQGRGRPNGSALNQIRSNDISLANPWELREWVIDGESGLLRAQPVAETPDFLTLNNTRELARLLNRNSRRILSGDFSVPQDLLAGSAPAGPFFDLRPSVSEEVFNTNMGAAEATVALGLMSADFLEGLVALSASDPVATAIPQTNVVVNIPWQAPGVDPEVRHNFALNTCSGCHRDETGIGFLHVGFPEASRDRQVLQDGLGAPAFLSSFLVGGAAVADPITGQERTFNDLDRRQADLVELIQNGSRQFHIRNRTH